MMIMETLYESLALIFKFVTNILETLFNKKKFVFNTF
jgi:hypothetical protein